MTSRKEVKLMCNKKSIIKSEKFAEQDLFLTNIKDSLNRKEPEKTQKDLMSSTSRN